jgi:hypothetical protein
MAKPDLTLLRPGVRVKLRGDAKPQPNKPHPKGWQTVVEVDTASGALVGYTPSGAEVRSWAPTALRVESDLRWLPVSLIEEIAP